MTYDEFKQNFLGEFLKIKSFAGKMKYAGEHLTRIGSGTGRVVFDIDGEKVLKLAKNPKGIAQNEAEAGAGRYPDTHDIVTEVFEEADNSEWLISEKAKKVNEKRIKDITGIPSLNDVYMYLRNNHEQNKGKRAIYGLDKEMEELIRENEWVQELENFINNYSQSPGDMGRPSTYGEVLRGGQPTIVLTDYGLNDEVYDTHYNPERKQRYRMYELYNFADGNDDILSDMPPQDAVDTRQGMWGLVPYGVGDGDGVINEGFISFVLNRDKYPTRPLPSTPYILDEFHNVVNNLNEVLNKVSDKKKFYNNLLELQDYLIRGKFYDRDPLGKQMVNLDEVRNNPLVPTIKLETEQSDKLASKLARKLGLGMPQPIDEGGANGRAYMVSGNRVLKITIDVCEVNAAVKTKSVKPKTLVNAYAIYKIQDLEKGVEVYAIIMDFIPEKPKDEFTRLTDLMEVIQPNLYVDLLGTIMKQRGKGVFIGRTFEEFPELAKTILTANPTANIKQIDRQKAYQFMLGLYEIKKDLVRLEITSNDFMTLSNLGYKDGVLIYFDIGGCGGDEPNLPANAIIALDEDGSALYSTENSFGQDNFPVHNNDDTSPSIENDLNANSSLYEDLEYNHVVGDATQDEFQLSERVKSYMPNSSSVEVKKKCRLGGNGSTSTACNQGDISNLNIKSLNEEIDASEAYRDEGALGAMVRGKKDVAIIMSKVYQNFDEVVAENDFGLIPIKQTSHSIGMMIVYRKTPRGETNAKKLEKIMISHGGYVSDKTPGEAYQIGKLLDYSDESILKYINRIYRKLPSGEAVRKTSDELYQYDKEHPREMNEQNLDKSQKYYRAIEKNLGETVEFEPEGYYEAIDDDGNPIFKYDTFWVSDKPEVSASKSIGGAVMGLYSMFMSNGKNPTEFFIYVISEKPDVDISHWEMGDFGHIKEVRYRRAVQGKYLGKIAITDDFKKRMNAFYEINGLEAYDEPDEETSEIFQDTDYEKYLDNIKNTIQESIHKHIFRNPEDSLKAILSGKKDIDFIDVNKKFADKIEKNKIGIIPVRMTSQNSIMSIVYTNKEKALKLYEFLKTHDMHLTDKTAEEAREIGQLMGYREDRIEEYIRDKYGDINEGTGDALFAKLTHQYQDPYNEFDIKWRKEQNIANGEEVITYGKDVYVKNPKTLNYILGESMISRGVIDADGNFYAQVKPQIHQTMLEQLGSLGLIDFDFSQNWFEKLPENFVTVERKGSTNDYYLGETHIPMIPMVHRSGDKEMSIPTPQESKPYFQVFLDKAKRKNPNINFINQVIGEFGVDPGNLGEGVGDKYFEKLTGRNSDEFSDFDTKYAKEQYKEDIVWDDDDWVIIKNPKSWENIKAWVRGVIDKDGNLYVEQQPVEIHEQMLGILEDMGVLSIVENWDTKIPTEFVTVQRYGTEYAMLVGESNAPMIDDEKRPIKDYNRKYWDKVASKKDAAPVYQQFLDKAKSKNPQMKFINEHIRDYNDNKQLDKGAYPPTFPNDINEVGEVNVASYPFDIKERGLHYQYNFKTEDNDNYVVNFTMEENDPGDDKRVQNKRWHVGFYARKYPKNAVLNKGRLYKVMSTIVAIMKDFILMEKPVMISYEPERNNPDDERRAKLYMTYIGKNLPSNYSLQNVDDFFFIVKKGFELDIDELQETYPKTISENVQALDSLKQQLAQAAQKVYDAWEQDEEGYCDSYGNGGICHDIASAMCDVLWNNDIECTTVSSDHEVHVYVVAKTDDGIYYVDIPYRYYETGGGYCWKKIPDVEFDERYVVVDRLSSDPDDFNQYTMDESKQLNEGEIMSLQELPFKQEIEQLGGKIFSVGGAVRDEFLGKQSKDLDVLITGVPLEDLEAVLSKYGRVDAVGKSFGILKFKPKGATEDIDIAIPRTETATGEGGHQGFDVKSDHTLPIEDDLSRRDFTVNAIAKDTDGNIVDPYNGREDLQNKVIRVVNPQAFSDDPLRMLRAVQFASRFGFTIEPETMQMIRDNANRVKEIAPERILTEFDKIIKKGNISTGAFLLKATGLLKNIFGRDGGMIVGNNVWENVKTMAEFIYMLSHNLVQNPAEFYKNNLKGDIPTYKELRALEMAFDSGEATNVIEARSVAHNMYVLSPQSLESQIIPPIIKTAAQDLLSGKYPKTVNELAVNGNDLMSAGLKGKEVGDAQKMLLLKIYSGKVRNNKEELLSLTGQNKSVEEGVGDKYFEKLTSRPDVTSVEDTKASSYVQREEEKPFKIIRGDNYGMTPTAIYKNPKSLNNFGENVRAIADKYGDLYVALDDGWFNHGEMAKKIGLRKNDMAVYDNRAFVLLHRIDKTNKFGLADSSEQYIEYGKEYYDTAVNLLRQVKRNNPQYMFFLGYFQRDGNDMEEVSDIQDSLYESYNKRLDAITEALESLNEHLEYPEIVPNKYLVNGQMVGLKFFINKYDEWNNQGGKPGYSDPSRESVLEFFQNNYEDFSTNKKLMQDLLWALTDRELLNENNG